MPNQRDYKYLNLEDAKRRMKSIADECNTEPGALLDYFKEDHGDTERIIERIGSINTGFSLLREEQKQEFIGCAEVICKAESKAERARKATAREEKAAAKEEEKKFKHKCFLVEGDTPYMEVFNAKEERYSFAFLKDGIVNLIDRVGDTLPIEIPLNKDGDVSSVMQMPSENIVNAQLLTPQELLSKIKHHESLYCDLPPLDAALSAWYTLFTWFHRKVHTTGYLRFLADTGKGKSRMLEVIGDLCFYPLTAGGAGSFSGTMRQHEVWHGTLMVDENDIAGGTRNQTIKYYNQGLSKRGIYILSNKQDPGAEPEIFNPFGPKIFGMREPFHDVALEGRLLSISPHETRNKAIPILLEESYYEETAKLRDEIARFVLEYWNKIDGNKLLSFRDMGIEPRLQQLAMPVSIIFQLFEEGENEFRTYMIHRQKELKKERAQSWAGTMFNLVHDLATGDEMIWDLPDYYDENHKIVAVTPGMVAKTLKISTRKATEALSSIGFVIERPYVNLYDGHGNDMTTTKKRIRCYKVPSEQAWNEITQRYHTPEKSEEDEGSNLSMSVTTTKIPEILKSEKFLSSGHLGQLGRFIPHTAQKNEEVREEEKEVTVEGMCNNSSASQQGGETGEQHTDTPTHTETVATSNTTKQTVEGEPPKPIRNLRPLPGESFEAFQARQKEEHDLVEAV